MKAPTSNQNLLGDLYPSSFLQSIDPTLSDAYRYLNAVFVDTEDREEWAAQHRQMLGAFLELAHRYGQLDDNTCRRLTLPDPVQFWGKWNELLVAHFLESKGLTIQFNPLGRRRHYGEVLLDLDGPIFIEVKTMFPHTDDSREARYLDILCAAAERVNFPAWILIEVSSWPNTDFQTKPFCEFLKHELPRLARMTDGSREATYEDTRSGLIVSVIYGAELFEGPVSASPSSGVKQISSDDSVRASLKKAYRQLPEDLPSLVVLCDKLRFPISSRQVENALYGTLQYLIPKNLGKPLVAQTQRLNDGFFSRCSHARLSAVGILDDLGEKNNPKRDLVIYHHPCPRYCLNPPRLHPISSRQQACEIIDVDSGKGLRTWYPYREAWPKREGESD